MTTRKPIVVTVHGGVVQDVQFPVGCKVIMAIRDYDTDGADDPGLDHDERGDAFVEALWKPAKLAGSANQVEHASVPAAESQPDVPSGIAFMDCLTNAEAKSILAGIYRWLYWDGDRKCWSPDMELSGADTIQFLCGLLPSPPQDIMFPPHKTAGGDP